MSETNLFYPFLPGERLFLREVRSSDVNDAYYRWMNNPEVTRYLESRFYPNSLESMREYVESKRGDRDNIFLAIVLKEGHRHIGNIKLGPVHWIHRSGDIGILIGEEDCWGQGYASEAIRVMVDYAFDVLNLHKLTAGCYDLNKGSAKAFQKIGFQVEGLRKQHYYYNGKYLDEILLGLVREQYRP